MLITTSEECPYSKYIPIETVFSYYEPNVSTWSGQPDTARPDSMIQFLLQDLMNSVQQDGGNAIIGFRIQFFPSFTASNQENTWSAVAYGTSIKKP